MSAAAYLTAPEPMQSFLLREAKLDAPRPPRATVIKRALLHRLCTARKRALLVTAPAGYGKTTLLAEWERRDRRQFAWVNADMSDDDSGELVMYLAAAASRAGADCKRVFPAIAQGGSGASAATLLARSLATLNEPIVIVIDDAHTLTSDASRKLVVTVLDALGDGSQLVLSGRQRTLFAGQWLTSRCDAAEVRIADLPFGLEEPAMPNPGAGA